MIKLEIVNRIDNCKIIELPIIHNPMGNLSFIEEERHFPFKIERAYWIYDVPGGQIRGGHAFFEQHEMIIAISGSFDVVIEDGTEHKVHSLNRSYYGLYIPSGIWRRLENFSTNSLALVLSSTKYSEDDYIRDYNYYKNTFIKK